jgi:hypothetical protein
VGSSAAPPPVALDPVHAEVERLKAEEIAKAKALALSAGLVPAPVSGFSSGPASRGPPRQQQQQQHTYPAKTEYGHQEIDINDLPPRVLQKIMAKRFHSQIENEFKVAITVKGIVLAPGAKREKGDIPLTMLVDAPNASNVRTAVAELNRLIEKEVRGLSESQAFNHVIGANPTKYKL